MSISFYGNELINIAIGIERRGLAFYDVMAKSTGNAAAREITFNVFALIRKRKKVSTQLITLLLALALSQSLTASDY